MGGSTGCDAASGDRSATCNGDRVTVEAVDKRRVVWQPSQGHRKENSVGGSGPATQTKDRPFRSAPLEESERPLDSALSEAVAELDRQRVALEEFRGNGCHGVPFAEAEQWCTSIALRLTTLGDRLAERLEDCQTKLRQRDMVIRRMHSELQSATASGSGARSPRIGSAEVEGPCGRLPRLDVLFDESTSIRASSKAEDEPLMSPVTEPSSLIATQTRAIFASHHGERFTPLSARARRSGDPTLQKCSNRRGVSEALAMERQQITQLRKEAAQLRRGHAEVAGQLRVRDAQVDQLKSMLKDLVQQRSMGLYARQFHLQEGAELQADRTRQANELRCSTRAVSGNGELRPDAFFPQTGVAAVAAAAMSVPAGSFSSSGSNERAAAVSRGVRSGRSAALTGYPLSAAAAAAVTAATASAERRTSIKNMVGGASLGCSQPHQRRDGSAAPQTPRGKLRDVVGHPTRVAVETPATRRRTTSVARTIGRSTSAEDRTARRAGAGGDCLATAARARR
eukprot:TRINITY_DN24040_c0_g1_i1.p1 TRINITY_DN24040_c0_g1~~TRINITY_DN24040_c0_g1_i1.p1  ORF type:complete len:511 (+),score=80.47 TRINITY_DN24040_c0_g1_i1:65-1597(+)